MRISIFTLLSLAFCGLVTSCYPPLPQDYDSSVDRHLTPPPVQKSDAVINDEGQKRLEAARNHLENTDLPSYTDNGYTAPSDSTVANTPPVKPKSTKYPYGTKVPGKPGYVFNPYTKNQVDVRGIPSSSLVRDPHDADPTHKFRVP